MRKGLTRLFRQSLAVLLVGFGAMATSHAQSVDDLLPPDQAFALSSRSAGADKITAEWKVADGYYLYKDRFRFSTSTPGITLGEPVYPPGKIKDDEFFGKMETYREFVAVEIPITRAADAPTTFSLDTVSQGCADLGICYPPQSVSNNIQLAAANISALTQTDAPPLASQKLPSIGGLLNLGGETSGDELLDPDLAFVLSVQHPDASSIQASWRVADGYYLYRNKMKISLIDAGEVSIAGVETPAGEPMEDEFFGVQEVYYGEAAKATATLSRPAGGEKEVLVKVEYQGCAEMGVCYPPMEQTVPVLLSALIQPAAAATLAQAQTPPAANQAASKAAPPIAEQDRIAATLQNKRYWALPLFFGLGLLLAFTPCVFPMVPILSGIIVGQGPQISKRHAFTLSLVYVLAMAATYTVAGVLAGLMGTNIQVAFQTPWVLIVFSLMFVGLALSMFGYYELQIPAALQNRLSKMSNRQRGGSHTGVGIMGVLSALIVGPCVAAPLIGVLAVIGSTGDAALGGAALFVMSLGMGAPLLLIGASAGHILPRAGAWMDRIKQVFGVALLAVAIWMLERILPPSITMLLWATLLIVTATYMGALRTHTEGKPQWFQMVRGLGMVMLIYGVIMLLGVASGGRDPLQPLRGLNLASGVGSTGTVIPMEEIFTHIKSNADLDAAIVQAGGRPVVLDFYADWCVTCKEMERYTFSDPTVQAGWASAIKLQADVTANDAEDKALLKRFGLFGPPSILFFGRDGKENPAYRVVGFMAADEFSSHLDLAMAL